MNFLNNKEKQKNISNISNGSNKKNNTIYSNNNNRIFNVVKKYINGNGYDYVLSVYEGYNEHSKYEIVNGNKMYIETFNPHSGYYQLNGEMQINGYTYQINTFIYDIDKTANETQEMIVIIENAYRTMFEGL